MMFLLMATSLVIAASIWGCCVAKIWGSRNFYEDARRYWSQGLETEHAPVSLQPAAAIADLLHGTWPYQLLISMRAIGPILGLILTILSFTLLPLAAADMTGGGGSVPHESPDVIAAIPSHLWGMVVGAVIFLVNELLLVATTVKIADRAKQMALEAGPTLATNDPLVRLAKVVEESTSGVERSFHALKTGLDEHRDQVNAGIRSFLEAMTEAGNRITTDFDAAAKALQSTARETTSSLPLLADLKSRLGQLDSSIKALTDQSSKLDPSIIPEAAAMVGRISDDTKKNNEETNQALRERQLETQKLIAELKVQLEALNKSALQSVQNSHNQMMANNKSTNDLLQERQQETKETIAALAAQLQPLESTVENFTARISSDGEELIAIRNDLKETARGVSLSSSAIEQSVTGLQGTIGLLGDSAAKLIQSSDRLSPAELQSVSCALSEAAAQVSAAVGELQAVVARAGTERRYPTTLHGGDSSHDRHSGHVPPPPPRAGKSSPSTKSHVAHGTTEAEEYRPGRIRRVGRAVKKALPFWR